MTKPTTIPALAPPRPAPFRGAVRLAAPLLAALLAACAAAPEQPEEAPQETVWPAPPEPARYRYITTLRLSTDIKRKDEQDLLKEALTGPEQGQPVFTKPYGVAARGGRVYVTDTQVPGVTVFDLVRGRTFRFGFRREGKLIKPAGVATSADGMVYVADVKARRVIAYDGFGLYIRDIGSKEDFVRPTGVAASPDGSRVYVVDLGGVESDRHRLLIYSKEGDKLAEIGTRGSGEGQFNLPNGVATAPDGTVYVLDAGNFRIQAFTPDGMYLRAWGSVGKGLGQLARPRGIAVDFAGRIYVSDASYGNVQIFNPDGQLMLAIGHRTESDQPGSYPLVAGIAIDEQYFLYVVDQYFKKVEVLRYLGDI